jgi:glyoxylase-like metal-dependent hydrolase (beta-lactamase superfamily II)
MKRREFIKSGTTLAGLLPLLNFGHLYPFESTGARQEDVVRTTVGTIHCTFLRDTQFKYLAKDYFINANPDEIDSSLARYGATPGNIPSPFIAVLLQHNNRKILIDTGIGFMEKPLVFRGNSYLFQGKLTSLLQQEGIKKEDITDVIVTHFHPDHIGGVVAGEELNFPNARFHIHEEEWTYWHSGQSDNQPALFKHFIETNITLLKEKNLHLFHGDFTEIIPGITAVQAAGHTPGQIALMIESNKEQLLYISDAFLHPLHIERLDWKTNYDWDHEKARQSRVKLLDLAYKNNMLVNAFHFDFPGLGRIDKVENRWIWKFLER